MGKKSTTNTTAAKRERKRRPKYFMVRLSGVDNPKIVVSMTKKAAIDAVLIIGDAAHQTLLEAGKNDWDIIDLTRPAAQQSIVRVTEPLPQHQGIIGSAAAPIM